MKDQNPLPQEDWEKTDSLGTFMLWLTISVYVAGFIALIWSLYPTTNIHKSPPTDSITIDTVQGLPNWQRIDHYGVDTNKKRKGIWNEYCY